MSWEVGKVIYVFTTSPGVLKCPLLLASHLFPLSLLLQTGYDSKTITNNTITWCHVHSETGRILEMIKLAAWISSAGLPLLSVGCHAWLFRGLGRQSRGCPPFILAVLQKLSHLCSLLLSFSSSLISHEHLKGSIDTNWPSPRLPLIFQCFPRYKSRNPNFFFKAAT